MALKACRECKKEISTEAKTCPHCGASSPATNSMALSILRVSAVAIVGFIIWRCQSSGTTKTTSLAPVVSASPGWSLPDPDPKPEPAPSASEKFPLNNFEQKIMRLLLIDDLTKFANGVEGPVGYASSARQALVSATSDELQRAFEANEVAAEQAYGGRAVLIRGKVDSVNRDIANTPFISLTGGSNMFIKPVATMADGQMDYMASLKKGQQIILACDSARMLMTSAAVSNCVPFDTWLGPIVETTLARVPDALRGKYVNNLARLAVTAVAVAIVTPETSPCWAKKTCSKEFGAQIKRPHIPKLVAERLGMTEDRIKNILG